MSKQENESSKTILTLVELASSDMFSSNLARHDRRSWSCPTPLGRTVNDSDGIISDHDEQPILYGSRRCSVFTSSNMLRRFRVWRRVARCLTNVEYQMLPKTLHNPCQHIFQIIFVSSAFIECVFATTGSSEGATHDACSTPSRRNLGADLRGAWSKERLSNTFWMCSQQCGLLGASLEGHVQNARIVSID